MTMRKVRDLIEGQTFYDEVCGWVKAGKVYIEPNWFMEDKVWVPVNNLGDLCYDPEDEVEVK